MKDYIKTSLQWGLIGGLCMAIFRFLISLIMPLSIGGWEKAFYIPLLFCMVWGAVIVKRNQGNEITFGRALLVTFIIALVGVLINTLFAFALFRWINPDMGKRIYDMVLEQSQEQWEKQGLSEAQTASAKMWIDIFLKSPIGILLAMAWQMFVGTIIALVISAFVKRTDPKITEPENSNPPA